MEGRAMKMMPVLLGVMMVTILSMANSIHAKEGWNFKARDNPKCALVIDAHANMEITRGGYSGNPLVHNIAGWVNGYTTAINHQISTTLQEEGKATPQHPFDHFKSMKTTVIITWAASWCRDNPKGNLFSAITALTDLLH